MKKLMVEKLALAISILLCLSFVACSTTGPTVSKETIKSKLKPEVKKAAMEALKEQTRVVDCTSAKEYITTVNFLRDSRAFGMGEQKIKQTAMKIAGGCTGAAKRFIRLSGLLFKAKLDGRSTAKIASDIAIADERETETFIFVFKKAFLKKYLDLDVGTSVRMAKKMSLEYSGDQKIADADFGKLTEFCVEAKNLDLPRPKCAQLALRVVKYGEKFEVGIANSFIEAVEILRLNKKGPRLTTFDAIKIAEEIVQISPHALENFVNTYRFAVAKKGHKMDRKSAISLAKKIAAKTVKQLR